MPVTVTACLTAEQEQAGGRIDALDLEPVAAKLIEPEPGQTVMTLAQADQLIASYRCFLKLCAWYPEQPIVPSRAIDEVWHAHILDTAKYPGDCETVFGFFLHHFPYFGMRGDDDAANWCAAYERTLELFRRHFGIDMPVKDAAGTCGDGRLSAHCESRFGGSRCDGGWGAAPMQAVKCEPGPNQTGTYCDSHGSRQVRPRPDRAGAV